MSHQDDSRSHVYSNYLAAGGAQMSYSPQPLPDELGDTLYGPHLEAVGRQEMVVEIGAGDGAFLEYLQRKGFTNLTGVDAAPQLVNMAKKKGLNVVQGDGCQFLRGLESCSCGAIVAIDLVEHLTKPELFELLREVNRVLRAGGVLLLQTVNGQGLFPGQIMFGDLSHVTVLNPSSMSQLLAMFDFASVTFHESGPLGRSKKDFIRRIAWRLLKRCLNFCRWIEARKRQDIWTENMICRAQKK